jgi:hypothetical protein
MPPKKTTEKFIQDAIGVHGDKYDYSLVKYEGAEIKVKIVCKIHGEWEQNPRAHLKGHGCFKCGRDGLRSSNEEFVKKAKEVHGDKYDYSLIDYKNAMIKIKIICLEHGEFEQPPRSHLTGDGCKKCANFAQRKTTEQFIEEAGLVHGDNYDYSLVDYIGIGNKVKIICLKHGEFEQTPAIHLSGSGCRKCIIDKQRKTTEEFITEAGLVHGDLYDYSLVEYITSKDKIKIICKIHGEFEQTPDSHTQGSGCEQCGRNSKTTEQFVRDAIVIHGDKYDYSKVEYINNQTNIKIICKIHGVFEQSPNVHISINKCGCPYCVNKTEGKIKQFLNENKVKYITQFNIVYGRFDFLIEDKYILEIDGVQHFPKLVKRINPKYNDPEYALNNDILKMKKIIDKYPILRLFQPHIWEDKYDWKDLLLNYTHDFKSDTLYIRNEEKEIYQNHTIEFSTEYI